MKVIVVARRIHHGRFLKRSVRSWMTDVFCSLGGCTRSFVLKNTIRNEIADTMPPMTNDQNQPCAGVLAFSQPPTLVMFIKHAAMTMPPPNAPMNLYEESVARSVVL